MKIIVIVESCFGNTYEVARAIAERLERSGATTELVDAASAPAAPAADLILLGAPTHNLGLPSRSSRSQAAEKGASATADGVREWIARADPATSARIVTFSTRFSSAWSGSAAKASVKHLRRRGLRAERGADFVVTGVQGPLAPGELDRADDWAAALAG